MTKAEEILLEIENKHEHRMADHLCGREKEMVLDAINLALNIPVVVFSNQQERSRFQKDIDDCYAHEDEEEDEAEVCLAPSYRIIGCEYNDGRTCDGCKWLPKQT